MTRITRTYTIRNVVSYTTGNERWQCVFWDGEKPNEPVQIHERASKQEVEELGILWSRSGETMRVTNA